MFSLLIVQIKVDRQLSCGVAPQRNAQTSPESSITPAMSRCNVHKAGMSFGCERLIFLGLNDVMILIRRHG